MNTRFKYIIPAILVGLVVAAGVSAQSTPPNYWRTNNASGTIFPINQTLVIPCANIQGNCTGSATGSAVTSFNTQTGAVSYSIHCVSGCTVVNDNTSSSLTVTGGGGSGTSTRYLSLPTANCINANAQPLFSVADANAPLPGCIGNTQGFEQFVAAPGAEQYLYGQSWIPSDFSGIKFSFKFRSANTTGTVTWKVATACVSDGTDAASTTFGTSTVITTTVPSTTPNVITTSYVTPTVATCATSSLLLYEISRSATDTATGTADLLSVSEAISGSL